MTQTINNIDLERTCFACPEQYDAFFMGRRVGYLRLRHGYFYVACPDVGGEIVYSTTSKKSDGIFETDEEQLEELDKATKAIVEWIARNGDKF